MSEPHGRMPSKELHLMTFYEPFRAEIPLLRDTGVAASARPALRSFPCGIEPSPISSPGACCALVSAPAFSKRVIRDSLLGADEFCPNPTFSIGGTVTGASGPIALQNSNGTNVIVATDGSFAFETRMVPSAIYNVTVAVAPNSQTCMVAEGRGYR